MSERYVPIFMTGSFLRCLIVGGGIVAERKTATLLNAGATVNVVSPTLTPALSAWKERGEIEWTKDLFRTSHLKGATMVIGATNDTAVNERVFKDSCRLGIPVNIVDDPEHCTFIVPSVLKKGPFQVAVSTGGAAPALAARLRRDIEALISDEHVCMANELKKMRPAIKRLDAAAKERFWRSALSLCVSSYKGKSASLKKRLRTELKTSSSVVVPVRAHKGGPKR